MALLKPLVQVKDVSAKALPPSTLQVQITERIPWPGQAGRHVPAGGRRRRPALHRRRRRLDPAPGDRRRRGTSQGPVRRHDRGARGATGGRYCAARRTRSAPRPTPSNSNSSTAQRLSGATRGRQELKAQVLAALLKVPADPKDRLRFTMSACPGIPSPGSRGSVRRGPAGRPSRRFGWTFPGSRPGGPKPKSWRAAGRRLGPTPRDHRRLFDRYSRDTRPRSLHVP